jgi:hypothetical protein
VVLFLARGVFGTRNDLSYLYLYSARPWDYFIPHAEAALLGPLTRGFITTHLHMGFLVENSLFLGYLPLLLAAIGTVGTLARRRFSAGAHETVNSASQADELVGADGPTVLQKTDEPPGRRADGSPDDDETRRFVWGFVVAAGVAFLLSMPPTAKVLGIKVYLPSYLVFKLFPQFRAYARFGIMVTLCVAVLAGYGLALLIKTRLFSRYKVPAIALLVAAILLEFTIVPPFYSLDTKATTPYYHWLKDQPGNPVAAIYPMYIKDDFYNYDYFFQQRIHQKKLTNGAASDSAAELYRQSILDITNPATPGLLKYLGAKYVLVIPGLYSQPVQHINYVFPTRMTESLVAPGLTEVQRFADCYLYEVTAQPAEFLSVFGEGSYTPYNDPEGKFWHPGLRKIVVNIKSNRKQPAVCNITLKVMSARSSSAVTFELNGKQVAVVQAPVWPVDVVIPGVTLNPGRNTLVVNSDGRLANLTEVPGYSSVSAAMMLSDIQVEGQK